MAKLSCWFLLLVTAGVFFKTGLALRCYQCFLCEPDNSDMRIVSCPSSLGCAELITQGSGSGVSIDITSKGCNSLELEVECWKIKTKLQNADSDDFEGVSHCPVCYTDLCNSSSYLRSHVMMSAISAIVVLLMRTYLI